MSTETPAGQHTLGLGEGGSSFTTSGSVQIVPDERLNALFIQAAPQDIALIDRLLDHIDQKGIPDTEVASRPRLIPVYNTSAAEIANNLKEIYQHRLITSSSGGSSGGSRPGAEEFLRALRGGSRGGGRGGSSGDQNEPEKMSISVHEVSNSVVVNAPQALYEEVEQLVAILDQAAILTNPQTTTTIPIQGVSAAVIQQALKAMLGDQVVVTESSPSATSSATSGRPGGPGSGGRPSSDSDGRRRFFEFLRSQGGRGTSADGGRGGGGASRGPGGGPGGSGRGPGGGGRGPGGSPGGSGRGPGGGGQ